MSDPLPPPSKKTYRDTIQNEFDARVRRSPRYSLRAFARDLGISNQTLSQVLRGRYGISLASAHKIADALELSARESQIFTLLVQSEHARSEASRQHAIEKLKELEKTRVFEDVPIANCQNLLNWFHFALYNLFALPESEPTADWAARRLGLPLKTAEAAIDELFRAGLLKVENAKWTQSTPYYSVFAQQSSEKIRGFYTEVIQKGLESVEQINVNRRKITVSYLLVGEKAYRDACEQIDNFCLNLVKRMGENSAPGEKLYALSTQFFPLEPDEQVSSGS